MQISLASYVIQTVYPSFLNSGSAPAVLNTI